MFYSACEIFQNTISQVLSNISVEFNLNDDILVFGNNKKEHDHTLERINHSQSKKTLRICAYDQLYSKFPY